MEKLFWILEYLKVGFSYSFITFIWPMVIFRKFLRGKSRTYRLGFCVGTQILLINTVVLMLGWIKLFNQVTINILFWGSFFISAFWNFRPTKKNITRMKNFFSGTYGIKSLINDSCKAFINWIKTGIKNLNNFMADRKIEFILLLIILIYAVIYFSYGAFQNTSFGASDLYVHNKWTYELCEGQIFSAGIYPEAMHCFVSMQHMTFGIDIFSCLLFDGGIHTFLIFLSVYVFLKNVFTWKYSGHIVLVLFLAIDTISLDGIATISRFQWTLPQEFGYPALFVCAAFLIKYLKSDIEKKQASALKFWKNDDLFMFTSLLGATFAIHFYVTIMLFFVCVAIAIVLFRRVFSKKIIPLIFSAVVGIVIAVIPMASAFASGTKLQGSLYWALGVMGINEEDSEESNTGTNNGSNSSETSGASDNTNATSVSTIDSDYQNSDEGFIENEAEKTLSERVSEKLDEIYKVCLLDQFGNQRSTLVIIACILAVLSCIVSTTVKYIWKKHNEYRYINSKWYGGYYIVVCMFLVFEVLISAKVIGLPSLIERTRLYPFQSLFAFSLFVVPIDFIVSLFVPYRKESFSHSVGIACVIITFVLVISTGNYHGFLMWNLTRYNSAVITTKSIVDQMKPQSYTIVSSTDEIYQMIGKGYHEELISFVNQAEIVSYHIPTEYVFIYVEKNALQRNQYNFFKGPKWLAQETYQNKFGSYASFGKDYIHNVIRADMAEVLYGNFAYSIKIYDLLWSRTALMAKTYVWCQKFNEMYPNELHVFYEDEDFVCYYFKQNPRNLYELAVMDASAMIKPSEYPHPFWPEGTFN